MRSLEAGIALHHSETIFYGCARFVTLYYRYQDVIVMERFLWYGR